MEQPRRGPFRLVTVNTAPERAKKVIGRMIEELDGHYKIDHVANCTKIDEVASTVREHQPEVLFSASMWTPEEVAKIHSIAKSERPVQHGPDAVVQYLLEVVPGLLDSIER
ncbi:hypothetical protein BDW02DRAFT_589609 [Decorospora gaudefroyi]|uniref:Cobalamin B12-binding domain-containing protein n=1 Tax=Decorospora gaudefroyi TaxID=184978 RepID=A0A6A5KAD4_9PLEO|nr:hypothetical protein BDW02DRAFT_589609 [Decorospora gaudefroyi]